MSLFVGNVSRNVKQEDLQAAFEKFGKCTVNPKGTFAFVEFSNDREAEDALEELKGKDMGGLPINIEWSLKSGRHDPSRSRKPGQRGNDRGDRSNQKCFTCDRPGHYARDCRSGRRRSRSRSNERRNRRSRSRSHERSSRRYDRDRRGGDRRDHGGRRDRGDRGHNRDDRDRRDRRRRSPASRSPVSPKENNRDRRRSSPGENHADKHQQRDQSRSNSRKQSPINSPKSNGAQGEAKN